MKKKSNRNATNRVLAGEKEEKKNEVSN